MATPVVEQPLVISPHEASAITDEVQRLITAGDELSAWERVRHLHPADIGTIVSALPSASRDAIVTVVSPDTVAWMLRQMNPIQAARIGTRQGTGMLSSALSQVHPRVALETLRRLPVARARALAQVLGQPLEDTQLEEHDLDTAGASWSHNSRWLVSMDERRRRGTVSRAWPATVSRFHPCIRSRGWRRSGRPDQYVGSGAGQG